MTKEKEESKFQYEEEKGSALATPKVFPWTDDIFTKFESNFVVHAWDDILTVTREERNKSLGKMTRLVDCEENQCKGCNIHKGIKNFRRMVRHWRNIESGKVIYQNYTVEKVLCNKCFEIWRSKQETLEESSISQGSQAYTL